uniref:SHSP domain-containing protein n=1 Tax=Oryza punctata TaxID=4537 RepID=A0A0E0JEZ5_ORYPU
MESAMFGLETPLMTALQHLLDIPDGEGGGAGKQGATGGPSPTRAYVRDARAMAATPADVKELPGAYAFVVDMPGLKSSDIKVQVEEEKLLVISGERRRGGEEEKEDACKYLRMERRMGKFMRKFVLPDNADVDKISAVCQDGVLTVTVEKLPPPEPKKPKTIEVKVA